MNKEFYSIVSPCSNMLNYNSNCVDEDDKMLKNSGNKKKINMIFSLFITLFAMYLAYDCNKHSSMGMRLLYTVIAGLFSGIYLLYYLVVRVFLRNKYNNDMDCSSTSNNHGELFKKKNH
jgi:hypothetical protein